MLIVEKYTGERTYMAPSGKLYTREAVLADFPAALTFAHIVTTDENHEVMYAMENLSAMRSVHGIGAGLSEQEAIAAIQDIVNAPPQVDTDPSAEERIAAALEFQNAMAL